MAKGERRARRLAARAVRRDLARITPADCQSQYQSPLFGKLPPELRNEIFRLVLSECAQHDTQYYYGGFDVSGFQVSAVCAKVHLELLRTCRLVYHETRKSPLTFRIVHSFYPSVEVRKQGGDRAAQTAQVVPPLRFDRLSGESQRQLQHVHIIAPRIDRKDVTSSLQLQQFRPRVLSITVGWRDIRGRYANYASPVRDVPLKAELEELNLRIIDRRSSEKDLEADIGRRRDTWTLTREDGVPLRLVGITFEMSSAGSLEAQDSSWCAAHLTWKPEGPLPT